MLITEWSHCVRREFTLLNVVDEEQRTFVSSSVSLSAVQRHLIPPQYRPDSGFLRTPSAVLTASKYFALKVELLQSVLVARDHLSEQPSGAADETTQRAPPSQQSVKEYHYRLHMLAFSGGVVPGAALSYYLNARLYFPMVARNLLRALQEPTQQAPR